MSSISDSVSLIRSTNKDVSLKRKDTMTPDLQAEHKLSCSPVSLIRSTNKDVSLKRKDIITPDLQAERKL